MKGFGSRSARARAAVLILAGVAAGSLLSGPAVAHVGKKVGHLTKKHLDAIYVNVGEKASDANQLDGLDSTQFLRSNGKAADSDKLDGLDSAGFLPAAGKAVDADKLDNIDSAAFLQGATAYTRHFSCSGTSFQLQNNGATTGWDFDGSALYTTTGGALVRCNVVIPDGGIVTRVDFTVRDADAADDITETNMWRTNLASSIGTEVEMASGGVTTGSTGDQVLSDTTITSGTIDNSLFSYFVQVGLQGVDSDVAVFGVRVTYTISGTNGGG